MEAPRIRILFLYIQCRDSNPLSITGSLDTVTPVSMPPNAIILFWFNNYKELYVDLFLFFFFLFFLNWRLPEYFRANWKSRLARLLTSPIESSSEFTSACIGRNRQKHHPRDISLTIKTHDSFVDFVKAKTHDWFVDLSLKGSLFLVSVLLASSKTDTS